MSSLFPPVQSLEQWTSELKLLLKPDVNTEVVHCLFFHLVDLGMFKKIGLNDWTLANEKYENEDSINKLLSAELQKYSDTPEGFAIGYFISECVDPTLPYFLKDTKVRIKPAKKKAHLSKSSDLSNLQIVKKYGKQVEEFIEFEKICTEKLVGPNTPKGNARKIFNYILPKIQKKVTPRPWEQLSRRRHKK